MLKKGASFGTWVGGWIGGWFGQHTESVAGPQTVAPSPSGGTIDEQKAMSIAAFWANMRLISQTIATLPIGIYQRGPHGRQLLRDHHLDAKLNYQPNADMTAVTFWENFIVGVLFGNGFAEKRMIGTNLVALDYIDRSRFTRERQTDGSYLYRYWERNRFRDISEEMIFHVPGFASGGKFGMSAIKYGATMLGSAAAANDAASTAFKDGVFSPTYFKIDQILTPQQREQFRASMDKIRGALNAGQQPLLEGGMTLGTTGISPDDAQLLQSRQFSVTEVCSWFGTNPAMIGMGDKASSWASSSEQIGIWFLQYCLRPILKKIETAIWTSLLSPAERGKGIYAEFSVDAILRGDMNARREFWASGLQNGYINRNFVAQMENFPEIPGGDAYTVQSNLIDLTKLDQLGGQATVKPAK